MASTIDLLPPPRLHEIASAIRKAATLVDYGMLGEADQALVDALEMARKYKAFYDTKKNLHAQGTV